MFVNLFIIILIIFIYLLRNKYYLYYMKITLNPDKQIVKTIQEGLKQKNGYCPCRLEITEDTKCMCKEFREQISDPNFEGFCHCLLYYKSL